MAIALGVFLTVVVGACLQRVSGMGLGLVGGPLLMLMMGPVEGIMVINVLAVINAALITYNVRAHVDWGKFATIASVMVFGSIPGALLIRAVDAGPLLVIAGGSLLVALAMVTFGKKYVPRMDGLGPMLSAGVLGGFTNTLAGIAGPVITVYAEAARWDHRMYAATLQPIFMVGGFISVITKLLLGAGKFAETTWVVWPAGIAGMFVGITLGIVLSNRISRSKAHTLSLVVASAGAAVAMLRGIAEMAA